ncbi:MAG: UpxY family transcription antiterminator [Bryobacteraceae bacterium]|jgi:transcription antitermination factor NusG
MVTAKTAWFALTVAPRKEKVTAQTLRANGFEDFLPLYSSRRLWSDRIKRIERPLFPGYVFCRFDPRVRQAVLKTPCVASIVSFGKIPEPVSDSEISALQAVCSSGLTATPYPTPKIGSKVRLNEGPLRGLEGIMVEDKKTRLIISLTLLQRSVAVVIDPAWIAPIEALVYFNSH